MSLEYENKKEGVSRPTSLAVRSETTQVLLLALVESYLGTETGPDGRDAKHAELLALYGACKGSMK